MQHQADVAQRGDAVWITLRRDTRNLLDAEHTRWLAETVRSVDRQAPVAIVLTGAGDVFCGGADGPHLRATGTAQRFADEVVALFGALHSMPTPVIAALNGDALAGGFALACLADVVIAVEGARLGTIEASLGTWPMIAQVPALTRVPPKAAITNMLTGQPFDTERALRLGVLDEVVDRSALEAAVDRYVELIRCGGAAVRRGRPLMRAALSPTFEPALREGAEEFVRMFG